MPKYVRPVVIVAAAAAVLLVALATGPAGARRLPPCNPPKYRVGTLCVKSYITSAKGYVQITFVRVSGRPGRTRVAKVQVRGTFVGTCTDGTTNTITSMSMGSFANGTIRGSNFSFNGPIQFGRDSMAGHWISTNKAIVTSWTRTQDKVPHDPVKCTYKAVNVVIGR